MKNLFSTPEQGKRLKELVPELTSAFVWHEHPYNATRLKKTENIPENSFGKHTYIPALTLQELRDVIWDIDQEYQHTHNKEVFDFYDFESNCKHATAPELAAWVIERLEGTK